MPISTNLPPPLDFRDPSGFAYFTFTERVPRILAAVAGEPRLRPATAAVLRSAARAPFDIRVERLDLPDDERPLWAAFFDSHEGRRLGELPFFEAEAFVYRFVVALVAADGVEPFADVKKREFADSAAALEEWTAHVLERDLADDARLERDLGAALRGNTADSSQLSRAPLAPGAGVELVHDEPLDAIRGALAAASSIVYLADNAYADLWLDLLLIRSLLVSFPLSTVRLALKRHPMFVSDATLRDVDTLWELIDARPELVALRAAGSELRRLMADGALRVEAWPALNAPLHFTAAAFASELRGAVLTVAKGDANYRRAFEDRSWPAEQRAAAACAPQLLPALFLRVLKSDCVCGLDAERVRQLDRTRPDWRTSGAYGLVQLVARGAAATSTTHKGTGA